METTLTITAKGQVTLRKDVLRHLGVAPGDKVTVGLMPSGRAEIRAAKSHGTISEFVGCLRQPGGRQLTVDEIAETAARGWAGAR